MKRLVFVGFLVLCTTALSTANANVLIVEATHDRVDTPLIERTWAKASETVSLQATAERSVPVNGLDEQRVGTVTVSVEGTCDPSTDGHSAVCTLDVRTSQIERFNTTRGGGERHYLPEKKRFRRTGKFPLKHGGAVTMTDGPITVRIRWNRLVKLDGDESGLARAISEGMTRPDTEALSDIDDAVDTGAVPDDTTDPTPDPSTVNNQSDDDASQRLNDRGVPVADTTLQISESDTSDKEDTGVKLGEFKTIKKPETTRQQPRFVRTTAGINIRSQPTINSSIVRTVPKDSEGVVISGEVEADGYTWVNVKFGPDTTGWCVKQYLDYQDGKG